MVQVAALGLVLGLVLILWLRGQIIRLEERVRRLEEAGAAVVAASFEPGAVARAAAGRAAAGPAAAEPAAAGRAAAERAAAEPAAAAPFTAERPGVAPAAAVAASIDAGYELAEPRRAPAPATPPGPSWEVRIGSRLPAWIGSIALALAGAFLVKYSLDQGWLGPEVRVLLAAGFGLAAVLVGQRLARGTAAAGLVAAGVAVLYAAVLAATTLYGLLPPWLGFLLTAGITGWALLLALRHGPIVAVVGLLGGSLTPHLIQLGGPRPVTVSAYLLLLEVGLLQVSRRRGWTWLGPLSLLGLFAWAVVSNSPWSDAALLAGCLAAVVVLHGTRSLLQRLTVTAAVAGTLLLYASGALAAPMGRLDWIFLALLTAGMLVLGRLDERFEGLAWTGPALTALLLLLAARSLGPTALPEFLATTTVFALLYAIAGYAALWGAPRPVAWARLPAVVGPAAVLLAEVGIRHAADPRAGAIPAAALPAVPWPEVLWPAHAAACLLGLAALPLLRRGRDREAGAALAAGAAVTLLLAPVFDLDGLALTLTWCAHAVVLTAAAAATALPVLAGAAGIAAALTTANLVLRPDLHYPRPGALPVFNRLLAAYGLPAAAFAALAVGSARALARRAADTAGWPSRLPRLLAAAAVLLTTLLVSFELWHAAHPGGLQATARLPEVAGIVTAWLALALLLLAADRRLPGWWLRPAADLLAGVALLVAGIGLGIAVNPAFNDGMLALPGAGRLLAAYGAPAALFAGWAARRGRSGDGRAGLLAAAGGIAALFLAFVLVNLEVRHLFHPERLLLGTGAPGTETGTVENYAYSAAWLLFGALLMGAGVWRRRRILRFSALAVVALAVLKVFLYDTATLSDPYRVLSFLGLGICLLALAALYQRLEAHAT